MMQQTLADLLRPLARRFQREALHRQRKASTRAIRLGIQLGGVYELHTQRGILIVQVLEFRHKNVVVKEVEDIRRFNANPSNLKEYQG